MRVLCRSCVVGQLFLSMESLLSILKSLMGLNFPFDFFSSFSPSFLNSEERQSDASETVHLLNLIVLNIKY